MRVIRWTAEASDNLIRTIGHIRGENPSAAQDIAETLIKRIEQLAVFPLMGRSGELQGTRELVSARYVVVYRLEAEAIEILHVWHGAQDWR